MHYYHKVAVHCNFILHQEIIESSKPITVPKDLFQENQYSCRFLVWINLAIYIKEMRHLHFEAFATSKRRGEHPLLNHLTKKIALIVLTLYKKHAFQFLSVFACWKGLFLFIVGKLSFIHLILFIFYATQLPYGVTLFMGVKISGGIRYQHCWLTNLIKRRRTWVHFNSWKMMPFNQIC